MPFNHLVRPDDKHTFCHLSLVHSHTLTKEATTEDGRAFDLISEAVFISGGMSNVCPECLRFRRFPWPSTHGQTPEDEFWDDDEQVKALDAASREKTVD